MGTFITMRGFSGYTIILATIFSTIIHFFVLTLLDTFDMIPKRVPPHSNLFVVDLIPVEKAVFSPVKREVQKREEETEIKEEPKKETPPEREEKVKKKEEVTVTKRPTKEAVKPKVNDEQRRLTAIQEIEKRVAERGAAVTASQMERYFGVVQERVKGFWVIPDTLSAEDLETVVIIEIDREGHVVKWRFERSSGNPSFDQSAMRAITKATPFPPPPGGGTIEIGLVFQPD